MTYRKIGGIHWFRLGPICISFCISKRSATTLPAIISQRSATR